MAALLLLQSSLAAGSVSACVLPRASTPDYTKMPFSTQGLLPTATDSGGNDRGGGEGRPNPCGSSWIVLVCLLVWMHGATFGATLGDGVLKPLLILTLMFFAPIFALWSLPAMRRLLVALWYCTADAHFCSRLNHSSALPCTRPCHFWCLFRATVDQF